MSSTRNFIAVLSHEPALPSVDDHWLQVTTTEFVSWEGKCMHQWQGRRGRLLSTMTQGDPDVSIQSPASYTIRS